MATKRRKYTIGSKKQVKKGKIRMKKSIKKKRRKRKYQMDNYVYWPTGWLLDLEKGSVEHYTRKIQKKSNPASIITETGDIFIVYKLRKNNRYRTFEFEEDAWKYFYNVIHKKLIIYDYYK